MNPCPADSFTTALTSADLLRDPTPGILPFASPTGGVILLCGLLTLTASLLMDGYSYGTDDHLGLLPMYKTLARPDLYAQDWYIQAERQMNVRLFYLHLLAWAARPIGTPAASFLLYIVCCVGLYAGLAKLSLVFIRRHEHALLAAAAAMLSPVALDLGHSKLLAEQMLPNLMSYALVAWALYAAIRDRPTAAGFCLGIATLMQGLVGMLASVVVFATLLACHWRCWRRRWAAWLIGGLACLASAAPNIMLVLSAESTQELGNRSLEDFFIYARLRVPHHVLPSTWPAAAWAAGALMALCVLLAGFRRVQAESSPTPDSTFHLPPGAAFWTPVTLLLVAFAAGVVFVDLVPTTAVAKLHLFRGMTFFRVFAAIAVFRVLSVEAAQRRTLGPLVLTAAAAGFLSEPVWLWTAPILAIRLGLPAGRRAGVQRSRSALMGAALDAALVVLTMVCIARLWIAGDYGAKVLTCLGMAVLGGLFILERTRPSGAGTAERGRSAPGPSRGRFHLAAIVANRLAPAGVLGLMAGFVAIMPLPAGPLAPRRLADQVWRQFRMAVPDDRPRSAAQRAAVWASAHLPPDAVVLIDPAMKDFRYRSERSVVVDFKGVPFTTEGLRAWRKRVFDVCGLTSKGDTTWASMPDLSGAFAKLDGDALAGEAARYGAGYLALDRRVGGPWRLIHEDRDQRIYALTPSARAAAW